MNFHRAAFALNSWWPVSPGAAPGRPVMAPAAICAALRNRRSRSAPVLRLPSEFERLPAGRAAVARQPQFAICAGVHRVTRRRRLRHGAAISRLTQRSPGGAGADLVLEPSWKRCRSKAPGDRPARFDRHRLESLRLPLMDSRVGSKVVNSCCRNTLSVCPDDDLLPRLDNVEKLCKQRSGGGFVTPPRARPATADSRS